MYGIYGLGCIYKQMGNAKFDKAFFHVFLHAKQVFQASKLYTVKTFLGHSFFECFKIHQKQYNLVGQMILECKFIEQDKQIKIKITAG